MPIIVPRTIDEVRDRMVEIANQYGIGADGFAGSIIDLVAETVASTFQDLYALEDQSRIDTATGAWLDSWGKVFGQDRIVPQGGRDLTFSNVYLKTENDEPVVNYTANAEPITIPAGTKILDQQTGAQLLETLDTVVMTESRAFVRVVATGQRATTIQPGTYNTNVGIDLLQSVRTDLQSIPRIVAVVQSNITTTAAELTDDEMRSLILTRARNFNINTEDKLQVVAELKDVAKIVTRKFNSGSSSVGVYIEPTLGVLGPDLAALIRNKLEDLLPDGTRIVVSPMIGSSIEVDYVVELEETVKADEISALIGEARTAVIDAVNGTRSGETIVFDDIANEVVSLAGIKQIKSSVIKVNGIRYTSSVYDMRDIEYVYTSENAVSIRTL